jgi:predicted nucleic acid-binding Zn ribbon protein
MESWIRRKVFAEWRGHEIPEPVPDRTRRAGEAAAGMLAKLVGADAARESEVQRVWEEIVGPFLAGHSRPVRFRDGMLVVQVLQPTVRYELERVWRKRILEKLQERFGARSVREVRFRLG